MTKYIVVSDSHYNESVLEELIQYYPNIPILHCGDSELDDDSPVFRHIRTVAGNCDVISDIKPTERLITDELAHIFMCHGHQYQVKQTLLPLTLKAKEIKADIALFGHSHEPYCHYDQENNILLLNPGSIELPRIYPPIKTYALLDIHNDCYHVTFFDHTHQLLKTLTYIR